MNHNNRSGEEKKWLRIHKKKSKIKKFGFLSSFCHPKGTSTYGCIYIYIYMLYKYIHTHNILSFTFPESKQIESRRLTAVQANPPPPPPPRPACARRMEYSSKTWRMFVAWTEPSSHGRRSNHRCHRYGRGALLFRKPLKKKETHPVFEKNDG